MSDETPPWFQKVPKESEGKLHERIVSCFLGKAYRARAMRNAWHSTQSGGLWLFPTSDSAHSALHGQIRGTSHSVEEIPAVALHGETSALLLAPDMSYDSQRTRVELMQNGKLEAEIEQCTLGAVTQCFSVWAWWWTARKSEAVPASFPFEKTKYTSSSTSVSIAKCASLEIVCDVIRRLTLLVNRHV